MLTFNQYVLNQYNNNPYKREYGSLKAFKAYYIQAYGFKEWLDTLCGRTLSLSHINSLVLTLVKIDRVKSTEIPFVLSALQRHYSLSYPVVFGILTVDYWASFLEKRKPFLP
jgi:hypothetical protein